MIAATASAGTPASSAAFMRLRKAASTWSIGVDGSLRGRAPSGSVGAEADSLEVPEGISQPGGNLLGDSFFDRETDDGRAGPQRQPDPRWIAGPVGHRGRRGTVLEIEELDVPGRSRLVFARPAGSRLHGGDVIELLGLGKVWRRYVNPSAGVRVAGEGARGDGSGCEVAVARVGLGAPWRLATAGGCRPRPPPGPTAPDPHRMPRGVAPGCSMSSTWLLRREHGPELDDRTGVKPGSP